MKTCTKCGETKPLDDFNRNRSTADGRNAWCRECSAEDRRRYYEENRDKVRERNRQYREENRDKDRERKRRYYEENRDKELERQRRYQEENRDKVLEYQRRYREENRDYRRDSIRAVESESQAMSAELATVPPHTPWTGEEDAFLMDDNGMTVFQKAIHLGRTYDSCRGRRHHLRQAVAA